MPKIKKRLPSKSLTILLIDDDETLRELYRTQLRLEGFFVLTAANGKEGFVLAKEKIPNFILLDIVMPKMDGFETLRKLKKDKITQHIPVCMLTNLGHRDDKKEALRLGAANYIIKAEATLSHVLDCIRKQSR